MQAGPTATNARRQSTVLQQPIAFLAALAASMGGKRTIKSVWQADAVLAAFEQAGIKPMHAYRMWRYVVVSRECLNTRWPAAVHILLCAAETCHAATCCDIRHHTGVTCRNYLVLRCSCWTPALRDGPPSAFGALVLPCAQRNHNAAP